MPNTRRDTLLKRLENIKSVGPDIKNKTDDELELFVKLIESMISRISKE